MCTPMHICTHIYNHANIYMYIFIHTRIYVCVSLSLSKYRYIHIHVYTHKYIYLYTHKHKSNSNEVTTPPFPKSSSLSFSQMLFILNTYFLFTYLLILFVFIYLCIYIIYAYICTYVCISIYTHICIFEDTVAIFIVLKAVLSRCGYWMIVFVLDKFPSLWNTGIKILK